MNSFNDSFCVFQSLNAEALATPLFIQSFGGKFPKVRAVKVNDEDISPTDWRQYVALYRWPNGHEECVGFINYIKYRDVYLGGGMCVKADFYRRLPRSHFTDCRTRGGVAQIMLEAAAHELTDAIAIFGYCGDKKAYAVDIRAGFVPTKYKHLIVKPNANATASQITSAIEYVNSVGAF